MKKGYNTYRLLNYVKNEGEQKMADKLVLGGKEFNSRFILGSGKYNLKLIEAAVKQGGQRSLRLHYAGRIHRKVRIY